MEHISQADSEVFDFDFGVGGELSGKGVTKSLSMSLIMQLCCLALVSVCLSLIYLFSLVSLGA